MECGLLRKYYHGPMKNEEPRLHVLLSSKEYAGGGYKYHGTQMKSFQLTKVHQVKDISNELENYFNLKWNIGVHMIVYRDGSDMMGWHADDTQGEKLLFVLYYILQLRIVSQNADHYSLNPRERRQIFVKVMK